MKEGGSNRLLPINNISFGEEDTPSRSSPLRPKTEKHRRKDARMFRSRENQSKPRTMMTKGFVDIDLLVQVLHRQSGRTMLRISEEKEHQQKMRR